MCGGCMVIQGRPKSGFVQKDAMDAMVPSSHLLLSSCCPSSS